MSRHICTSSYHILFIYVSFILPNTVKPVLSDHSNRRQKLFFQDQLSLNAGQQYQREHPAILSTSIRLPFVFKIFVLSSFEWPLKTGFTVKKSTHKYHKLVLFHSSPVPRQDNNV